MGKTKVTGHVLGKPSAEQALEMERAITKLDEYLIDFIMERPIHIQGEKD